MRFNKAELASLSSNPTTIFDREGLLIITERQEGFFRRTDVNYPRWCKLRGNLLFYLKDHDPKSQQVQGILVLENCRPLIRNEHREFDGFAFILEFEGSIPQRISTLTSKERLDWVKCIQLASYSYLNRQIKYLEDQIAQKMGNRIESGTPTYNSGHEAMLLNSQTVSNTTYESGNTDSGAIKPKEEEDLAEVPICESALSCDNLCFNTDHKRSPTTRVVCAVLAPGDDILWREYARTEIVEGKNTKFLCTIRFLQSAGFTPNTLLRFTIYDVRERVSLTALPMAYAEVKLGVIQDATRFRIPLRSSTSSECGFITIASWASDTERQAAPPRSTTQVFQKQSKGHRRSQSLPPKLGVKLFVPYHSSLQRIFANPIVRTYRLHSAMGGDLSVQETLLESKLCFAIPLQLLSIWIIREKELLQEISGMGELGGKWRSRQIDLLDKHLKLLKDYSQAKQNLQQLVRAEGAFFKRSSVKTDESLEFIPVNLHLQRMCANAQNDAHRAGVLDIISVGAFTKHAGGKGQRSGGLIKLLHETKASPTKLENGNACKVQAANDAVQAIKQLRREIVEIMSQLLNLAKSKNPKGMMPLCNEMVSKSKTLMNLWEPSLVEDAFKFIEQHRIIEEPDNVLMPMSPFRKITQQLGALDLKSPELEDFATPVVAPPDLWPKTKTPTSGRPLMRSNSLQLRPSPSATDINTIHSIQRAVKCYNEQLRSKASKANASIELNAQEAGFQSLPVFLNNDIMAEKSNSESTNIPIAMDSNSQLQLIDMDEMTNAERIPNYGNSYFMSSSSTYGCDIEQYEYGNNAMLAFNNVGFLDTKIMSTSASANYYRPTEEPEPLDLTLLNIEASVMCLVSKIKFLCGRCGSPAIRLRHPKAPIKKENRKIGNSPAPDVVANQIIHAEKEDVKTQKINGNGLNLDLKKQIIMNAPEDSIDSNCKKGNKFTDGLDLSLTTDWASELRPSMRKLRHAMDGLLKTARLMHSVQRLQQDMQRNSLNLEIMYRRDVCFSQALTALISSLMARLWGTEITTNFIKILCDLGPLAYFEGLLSLYGGELDMWGDMCIAIEDLLAVSFTLVRSNVQTDPQTVPTPRVTGSRQALNVLLPVPENVFSIVPTKEMLTFKVTPVFFNIGINEKATIAETLGQTREQHRSNWDNFVRLKQYYNRFRKLQLIQPDTLNKHEPVAQSLVGLLDFMEEQLRVNVSKNVKILHLGEDACRLMMGLRFTSCKSAKDRTGMSITLEQCRVLVQDFNLPAKNVPNVLSTMRSEGTRMDNVEKNIEKRKYAFNLPQVLSLPAMYRPPVGVYGKAET